MIEQRPQKKISINLIDLPKLRHKSTHQLNTTFGKKLPELLTEKTPKYLSHFIHHPKHSKSLSRLESNLSRHRSQFRQLTSLNQSLLNTTFSKLNETKKNFDEKKKLQKKKVFTMEKQSFLSRHQPKAGEISKVNMDEFNLAKKKDQLYTGPMIVLDYKIQMSWLNHSCFDGIFSLARTGATLAFKDDALYLFGGYSDTPQTNLLLHKYQPSSNQWHHINSHGQKPMLSLMYHTCNSFRDYLIFIGGVSIQKIENKRFSNNHINIFNTSTKYWIQYNWGLYIKQHVSCMIGNVVIVHGGINERQKTENCFHVLHLNLTNLNFSKVFSFTSTEALSHHRMITTFNQDSRLRTKFKIDGVLIFGGKRSNERLSNEIYYLQASSLKLTDDDIFQTKKWQLIDIKGPKPEARMSHTFDLLQNKGLCVLIGGINERNEYLNDMWVFDLFGLTWTHVEQVPLLSQTGGIAYHCSVVNDSEIYVYGGITVNRTQKQFYLIETQKFKRKCSKHQSRKKVDISSNMISFKAFQ